MFTRLASAERTAAPAPKQLYIITDEQSFVDVNGKTRSFLQFGGSEKPMILASMTAVENFFRANPQLVAKGFQAGLFTYQGLQKPRL